MEDNKKCEKVPTLNSMKFLKYNESENYSTFLVALEPLGILHRQNNFRFLF